MTMMTPNTYVIRIFRILKEEAEGYLRLDREFKYFVKTLDDPQQFKAQVTEILKTNPEYKGWDIDDGPSETIVTG